MAPSCPGKLPGAGLVSNWEAQSCAGEQPFGVQPLVGPGGWRFSPPKEDTAGWGQQSWVQFVSPLFEMWPGASPPFLALSPRCCSFSACLSGINYFCRCLPCCVSWSLSRGHAGLTTPHSRWSCSCLHPIPRRALGLKILSVFLIIIVCFPLPFAWG